MENKKPVLIEADKRKIPATLTRKRCPICGGKWTVENQGAACPNCKQR